jgi:acetyl-CoA synthetase
MVFYTRRAKVTTWYTAPTAIRRLMRMEDIKPKEAYNLENLRSILSVGEPLNAEANLG